MSYECDNDNHAIGCQCPGIYKGMISRQDLIKFLQERTHVLEQEADELYNAAEKASEQSWKDEFWQQYSASIAKQLAYREVAEWAKKQVEDGSLIENRRD
jgi:hypothetical protein